SSPHVAHLLEPRLRGAVLDHIRSALRSLPTRRLSSVGTTLHLVHQPTAPIARDSAAADGSPSFVSITIGMLARMASLLIWGKTAQPPLPAKGTPSRISAGGRAAATSAWAPSTAYCTWKPSASRRFPYIVRMSGSSSTSRTLRGPGGWSSVSSNAIVLPWA